MTVALVFTENRNLRSSMGGTARLTSHSYSQYDCANCEKCTAYQVESVLVKQGGCTILEASGVLVICEPNDNEITTLTGASL